MSSDTTRRLRAHAHNPMQADAKIYGGWVEVNLIMAKELPNKGGNYFSETPVTGPTPTLCLA